jgi:hypothetical protein
MRGRRGLVAHLIDRVGGCSTAAAATAAAPGCFTAEMSHSTQGNPQGSILLDRCTGKTWLLLCIRNDTAGCAFRWAPPFQNIAAFARSRFLEY